MMPIGHFDTLSPSNYVSNALLSGSYQRREPLYEETRVDCRIPLGGVAGRGPISTTAAGCRRPHKQLDTPRYRRYLHRRNDRDVLQRTHRPEHGWLRIARRYGIEQRYRIEQRVCIEQRVWIERWCGWRWHHRIVNSALLGVSATQRIVQLTKTKSTAGRHCPSLIECDLPSTAATHQLRRLGDVDGDAPRLVLGQQLGRCFFWQESIGRIGPTRLVRVMSPSGRCCRKSRIFWLQRPRGDLIDDGRADALALNDCPGPPAHATPGR